MTTLIPPSDLFAKLSNGTAFQATAAQATLAAQQSSLNTAASNFFSDQPGAVSFPTILPQYATLPQASDLTALGTQMNDAATGLTGFGTHLNTQLAAMPQNLNIYASHNSFVTSGGGAVNCLTSLGAFFGSILNLASGLLGAIGSIFATISSGIAAVIAAGGTVLSYIQNQLAAALATVQATLGEALSALTAFISSEIATLAGAVSDLINNATSLLFSALFKDACIAQLMGNPSLANTLGAGNNIVVG